MLFKIEKKFKPIYILPIVLGIFIFVFLSMTIAVISGNVFYQYHLATVPRVDLLPILTKEEKEENDYKVIYEQTGLTKEGYLRIEDDIDLILDIQNDYYSSYNIIKKNTAPFLMSDFLDRKVSHCLVKKGDIIITSAVQFSGIRLGHTALVINEEEIIEAVGYGSLSHINKVDSFMERPSFLIVSPNFDEDVKDYDSHLSNFETNVSKYQKTITFTKKNPNIITG